MLVFTTDTPGAVIAFFIIAGGIGEGRHTGKGCAGWAQARLQVQVIGQGVAGPADCTDQLAGRHRVTQLYFQRLFFQVGVEQVERLPAGIFNASTQIIRQVGESRSPQSQHFRRGKCLPSPSLPARPGPIGYRCRRSDHRPSSGSRQNRPRGGGRRVAGGAAGDSHPRPGVAGLLAGYRTKANRHGRRVQM